MSEKKNINNILNRGYTILKNVIDSKECDEIKKITKQNFKIFNKKTKIKNTLEETIYNLHNKNTKFIKYLDHPKIINIVKKTLSTGSFNNNEKIILRQSAVRSPKKGFAQQLHNDSRISKTKYPIILQVIWLLDDFTKDNGATRILPQSQLFDGFPKKNKKYKNEKMLTGKKGSVIIFNASVWHGSSEKFTNEDRYGMIFSYSRWFLKSTFDHTKNTPIAIYKKLTNFQKELLGFKFNPPTDEFERASSRSNKNIITFKNYNLKKFKDDSKSK